MRLKSPEWYASSAPPSRKMSRPLKYWQKNSRKMQLQSMWSVLEIALKNKSTRLRPLSIPYRIKIIPTALLSNPDKLLAIVSSPALSLGEEQPEEWAQGELEESTISKPKTPNWQQPFEPVCRKQMEEHLSRRLPNPSHQSYPNPSPPPKPNPKPTTTSQPSSNCNNWQSR